MRTDSIDSIQQSKSKFTLAMNFFKIHQTAEHIRTVWTTFLLCLVVINVKAQELEIETPTSHIAFIADSANALATEIRDLTQQELGMLVRDEFSISFPNIQFITSSDVQGALLELMVDEEVTMIVTLGIIASDIAVRGAPWPKPVIAGGIFDAAFQGFPETNGTSGVENLTYIAPPSGSIIRDLLKFRELSYFEKVALLIDEVLIITYEAFINHVVESALEQDIVLVPVPVGATTSGTLEQMSDDIDAVYLTPLPQLNINEFQRLAQALTARGLPSFSYTATDVEKGIAASLESINVQQFSRRVALNIYRILLGDDPSQIPVTFPTNEDLVINMRTLNSLSIVPPLNLALDARRLFETPENIQRSVTLLSVMEEARMANLELAIEDQVVAVGLEDVRIARSGLLPQLEIAGTGTTVSKEVAESSFGMQPQHSVDSRLTFQQLLYSPGANANLSAQKSLQQSREQSRETVELDVILQAAEAYLNLLRTKTLEQVQQDNLELTLTSLQMAEQRERIGTAGPGERLRLTSELSRRRADRISAFAQRSVAETALNQILNRPLNEPFTTPESDLEGRALLEGSLSTTYLSEISRFNILANFLSEVAINASPEIRSLDAAIAAQEFIVSSTRQTFYLPSVALQGNLSTNLLREGAGSEAPSTGFPATESPNFPWSAGVSVSLPLFQGNARYARRNQSKSRLIQLQLQRELASRGIEQNLRAQLQFAATSLAVVRESESAAETARQSLDIVTDAYEQGLVNVVDLLQAQTNALISQRGVTNAIFDYLINLKRVERAVGQFEAFSSPEERANFIEQLDIHIQALEQAR